MRLADRLDKIISGSPARAGKPYLRWHRRYYPWRSKYSILAYVSLIDHYGCSYEIEWCHIKALLGWI